jgi:hypothetical protein
MMACHYGSCSEENAPWAFEVNTTHNTYMPAQQPDEQQLLLQPPEAREALNLAHKREQLLVVPD